MLLRSGKELRARGLKLQIVMIELNEDGQIGALAIYLHIQQVHRSKFGNIQPCVKNSWLCSGHPLHPPYVPCYYVHLRQRIYLPGREDFWIFL